MNVNVSKTNNRYNFFYTLINLQKTRRRALYSDN